MRKLRAQKPCEHTKVRLLCAALCLACLWTAATTALAETSQDQRIADLERELADIKEGIAAGQDVSARIAALERGLAEVRQQTGGPAAIQSTSVASMPGPDSESAQLPPGVQGAPNPMRDEITHLTGDALLDESFPRSLPIPGTSVRFAVGGYMKADFIQDLDYIGDRHEFELATIPVDGSAEAALDGRTTFQAKESRLNFDFRSRARNRSTGRDYPLQAFLELDFFDDREDFALQPRLRQAYGVIGRLLVGQTWTTSGDLDALAGTIDFSGGDALYGGRLAQIRWQDMIGERLTWAVALEDPRTSIGNPLGLVGEDRPSLPNFAGKLRWEAESGSHVQLGADLFQLRWQGAGSGSGDETLGYGLNLTGRLLLGPSGQDAIMGGGSIGRGSAHRVVSLSWDGGNDAVITPDGLDAMDHWQAYIGYSHYWTPYLNSTISTAWTELDNAGLQPGSTIHRAGSAHLNLIWFPYPLASTGIEVMWGERVDKNGDSGDAWRIQGMVKYKFN